MLWTADGAHSLAVRLASDDSQWRQLVLLRKACTRIRRWVAGTSCVILRALATGGRTTMVRVIICHKPRVFGELLGEGLREWQVIRSLLFCAEVVERKVCVRLDDSKQRCDHSAMPAVRSPGFFESKPILANAIVYIQSWSGLMIILHDLRTRNVFVVHFASVGHPSLLRSLAFNGCPARSDDCVNCLVTPSNSQKIHIFDGRCSNHMRTTIFWAPLLQSLQRKLAVCRLDDTQEMKTVLSKLQCRLDRSKPRVLCDYSPGAKPWFGEA